MRWSDAADQRNELRTITSWRILLPNGGEIEPDMVEARAVGFDRVGERT